MRNKQIKVWLPAIRVGSGTDIFTKRMAAALERNGLSTETTWFSPFYEPLPFLLHRKRPPPGTDIIMTNSWNGYAFKQPDLPLIVTVHHSGFSSETMNYRSGVQSLYHRFFIRPSELRSLHSADMITSVSGFVAQSLGNFVEKQKIEVIHNWVDTSLFSPIDTPVPKAARLRLLFVGKMSYLKGSDLLFKIMEKLDNRFEIVLAGKKTHTAPLPANVRFLGWLNEAELIRTYRECDALLLPSRAEGFGYTALEAMACGKPVIASNVTSLPELVQDGITGLLCPVNDVDSFVRSCHTLADNPKMRLEMGHAARKRVVENFSENKAMTQYLSVINRLSNS